MTKPRGKRRKKPQGAPVRAVRGVRYADRGPITALRVLGQGFELPLDPGRSEFRIGRNGPPATDIQLSFPSVSGVHALIRRIEGDGIEVADLGSKNGVWDGYSSAPSQRLTLYASHSFGLGGVGLLALDERTHRLVKPLTEYGGVHQDVDQALQAVMLGNPLFLCGSRADDVLGLARMLHADSVRRGYPFVKLDELPVSDVAIRRLCARAVYGTVFVDLTKPQQISYKLAEILLSPCYDRFWTIMVMPHCDMALECFGGTAELAIHSACKLGFPRVGWQLAIGEVHFTER